ncbi:MAG: recombination protein O N-terminal domain-containing protein [Firmicutes bacterium]|uniref:Recombination protein O N-terminal domain-containing protein n=1 Tax=Candidatus Scatoplasma merdavium TaxID=2840932 RepID=A0A9D9GKM5_9BACL|nr:recombination protein O N-terminal domain-containing protein [Candidatus Scatoplasma merdavium]
MEQKIIPLTGYVLSASKYQDSDAVVNLLTKDGIVSGNIRGGYSYTSKNHIGAQIFNLIAVSYTHLRAHETT